MRLIRQIFCGLFLLLSAFCATAAVVQTERTEAELIAEMQHARPGETSWVALRLRPDRGWHTYWRNPGDSGLPTRISWTLPAGVSAGEIHWPYPQVERIGGITNYGYPDETLHLVPIAVPAGWPVGRVLPIRAEAKWLVCADICIPGEARLSLDLPVSAAAPSPDSRWARTFMQARAALPQPVDWPARFYIDEEQLSLQVSAAELRDAQQLAWFPLPNDVVNHSAAQRIAPAGEDLRLSQARSDYFTRAPERLEGVLVVTRRGETRAYQVSAQPGAVAPVADTGRASVASQPGPWLALGFALLGGLILNLMPCVFPVLSIKALALLEARDESPVRKRVHALVYTAGVLLSFLALAGLLMALRAGGTAVGWGFQLQQPLFVALLAYLFFAMGLLLSGAVTLGTRLMGLGQSLTQGHSLRGSFFTGVLAVVVASPCTAPFMGVAMGYAVAQPAAAALAVFAALGLGLALPFLLLGFVPALARILPRPGAWMETSRQAMAFPLYLTVVWLLWVLGGLTDRSGMALVLAGLVLLALALWLWSRRGILPALLRLAMLAAALLLLAHPALQVRSAPVAAATDSAWEPWSPARVSQLRAQGRTVLVNFTADWCVTCLANERVALDVPRVRQVYEAHDVALLKADWTREDPAITAELARFGRSGVPLYLVYREGSEARVLPQLLTPDIVTDAIAD